MISKASWDESLEAQQCLWNASRVNDFDDVGRQWHSKTPMQP